MKHNYSRKTRQLKYLAKRLKLALASADSSRTLIEKLKLKISLLLRELAGSFSKFQLKGILGSVAIIFGLSTGANAQTFGAVVQDPFGHAVVSGSAIAPITSADIDNDGDMDLFQIGASSSIQFFENTGTASAPAFAVAVTNPFGLTAVGSYPGLAAADLDNDGDMDLLVGELYGQIQYFENTGTAAAPTFAAPVVNPFGLTNAYLVAYLTVADIDNDGDIDILAGEYYGSLAYFENTGTASAPAFAAPVANPFGIVPVAGNFAFPNLGDMDGDGDFDLVVGEYYGSINYFENTGTASAPAFAAAVNNPFGLTSVYYYSGPHFVNLDDDCDMDLMISEYTGILNYFENTAPAVIDASVTVVGETITANEAAGTYVWLDCDNGNTPVPGETGQSFTATVNGNYAVEVTTVCGVATSTCQAITTVGLNENALFNGVSLYPNPTNGTVTIDLGELNSAGIKVTGMNGQVVYQKENIEAVSHQFNLNEAAGMYFVEISAGGESTVLKLIKK